MAVVWNAIGVYGTVVGLATIAMAGFVLLARPDRTQNRLLAAMMLTDGVGVLSGAGAMFLTDDPAKTYAWQALTVYAASASIPLYLAFLATLPSPLLAFLRPRAARWALYVAAALLGGVWMHAFRDTIFVVVSGTFSPWSAAMGEPLLWIFGGGFGPLLVLALFVSLDAWRRAPRGSAQRRTAGWYVVAFGTRDALFIVGIVGLALDPMSDFWGIVWYASVFAVFVPILAYAVLKTQMFDIDLKIKAGLSRGTVAALLLAAFFVASTIAQQFLTDTYGLAVGGVVAGLMLFALAPLQRTAERLADRAMPAVTATPEYVSFKKLEVYKAALESAAADGVVTERERAVLTTLRERLGIAAADAAAMEREMLARATG